MSFGVFVGRIVQRRRERGNRRMREEEGYRERRMGEEEGYRERRMGEGDGIQGEEESKKERGRYQ